MMREQELDKDVQTLYSAYLTHLKEEFSQKPNYTEDKFNLFVKEYEPQIKDACENIIFGLYSRRKPNLSQLEKTAKEDHFINKVLAKLKKYPCKK
ncbi:MAG: hypothetical protein QT05_C0003G0016 [archaeon GW2011_AR13]|nr:MAG: hypothetical protein QT05_C0003G0016 [archaeon GW2011_AR13]HIG94219.1 hypothetical protein [Nanoarchaeota archaeon]HIH62671.1 hypothetical protein [Nanoarchaeota archaeon]HIJ09878.1 hypothetical protein [Nanoarchaeota archaeon]